MKSFFAAVRLLTIAGRRPKSAVDSTKTVPALYSFPLIGFILGLILAALNSLLEPYVESEIVGTVHVTVLIILTGAAHLQGMQRIFDRAGSGATPIDSAAASVGIFGLLAVVLTVLFKIRAIEVIGETRSVALLISPTLARWAPLVFLYGLRPSADRCSGMAERFSSWQLMAATALALAAALYFSGIAGLWISLCVSLLALSARLYFSHSEDISEDELGTVIEMAEALSFVLFASL